MAARTINDKSRPRRPAAQRWPRPSPRDHQRRYDQRVKGDGSLDAGHRGTDAGIHLTDRDIHNRAAGGYPELACGKHRQDQTRPVRRTSRRPCSRHAPTPVHPGRMNSSRRVIDRPPRLLDGLEVNDGSLLAQGSAAPFPGRRLRRHGREDEAGAQRVPRVVRRTGPLDPQVDRLASRAPCGPGPPPDSLVGDPRPSRSVLIWTRAGSRRAPAPIATPPPSGSSPPPDSLPPQR